MAGSVKHMVMIMFKHTLFIYLYRIIFISDLQSFIDDRGRIHKDSFTVSTTSHRSQIYQRITGMYHIDTPFTSHSNEQPNAISETLSYTTQFDRLPDMHCTRTLSATVTNTTGGNDQRIFIRIMWKKTQQLMKRR